MNSNRSAIIVPPPGVQVQQSGTTALVTNDIRDIKPPVPVPNPWLWVWWGVALVVLIAGAMAAWLWWRKKQSEVPPVPVVPPHVRAKHRLAGALAMLHDPRQFCSLVSATLRVYLEERFSVRAPERTTEEFLFELQDTPILNADQNERLAEFLERCDLVKFARFEPTETELRGLLDAALRLIDETQYEFAPTIHGDAKVAIRPGEVAGASVCEE